MLAQTQVEGGISPLHRVEFRNEWNPAQIDDAANNIRSASKLGLPELPLVSPHDGRCIIVGSAPSVNDGIETIRELSEHDGALMFGINASYNFLLGHGIIPNAFVCYEVGPDAYLKELKPQPETTFYISSMCEPDQFRILADQKRVIWHVWSEQPAHVEAMKAFQNPMLVCGGSSSLLRSINIALALGYRDFDVFGFDCSFKPNESTHMIGTPAHAKANWLEITARSTTGESRTFLTYNSLAHQADDFRRFCRNFGHTFAMRVHGDGMASFIHRQMFPHNYEAI